MSTSGTPNLLVLSSEPEQAVAARMSYLALGAGRTPKRLAEELGLPVATVRRWHKSYGWETAAQEYDRQIAEDVAKKTAERRIAEWEERKNEQLQMARLQRLKAYDYLKDREIEGVYTDDGIPIVKGMDPQKAEIARKFIADANQTERLVLGEATERIAIDGNAPSLSIEMVTLELQRALKIGSDWRKERGLPALEEGDPLGEYGT